MQFKQAEEYFLQNCSYVINIYLYFNNLSIDMTIRIVLLSIFILLSSQFHIKQAT